MKYKKICKRNYSFKKRKKGKKIPSMGDKLDYILDKYYSSQYHKNIQVISAHFVNL